MVKGCEDSTIGFEGLRCWVNVAHLFYIKGCLPFLSIPKRLMKTRYQTIPHLFFIWLLLVVCMNANGQVVGCKDPAAINFNSSATITDSSCLYSTTFYTPPVKVNGIDNTLLENSGLQWAGNALWSFNDGNGAAAIYRIDTTTGSILQTVYLQGATNIDWEDIAFDGTHLYIGDFGNNFGGRTDLKIYKFPLSAIPAVAGNITVTIQSSEIDVIYFTYSDQVPVIPEAEENKTKFDCEAMIVDGGKIHLFTKNWIQTNTTHYVIASAQPGTYAASPVETLNTAYLVTGADIIPGAKTAVLLGYQNGGVFNHYMHVLTDFTDGLFFTGNRRKINLPSVFSMGQAEGITFVNNTFGFIGNEAVSALNIPPKLFSFNSAAFTPLYVLPFDLINFNVQPRNNDHVISWHFNSPVKNLSVMQSTDGVNFKLLRKYPSIETEQFTTQALSSQTCYKLQWELKDGGYKTSQLVWVKGKNRKELENVVLLNNGELSLTAAVDNKQKFRFALIQVDGKLIEQTEAVLLPGTNKIRFNCLINRGSLIVLQATNKFERTSLLLRVD